METIILNIKRDIGFVSAIIPYCISINGKDMGKLLKRKSASYEMLNAQSTLKVSIPQTSLIHKAKKVPK